MVYLVLEMGKVLQMMILVIAILFFQILKKIEKKNRAESKNYEHQIYKKISDKDANSETDDTKLVPGFL